MAIWQNVRADQEISAQTELTIHNSENEIWGTKKQLKVL